jgi:hypothetical protein
LHPAGNKCGVIVAVRAVLKDGRVVRFVREVEDDARLTPAQLLTRLAQDGLLSLSDSDRIPLDSVAHAEYADEDTQPGPGWGPGLQDEDAASAAASNYQDV